MHPYDKALVVYHEEIVLTRSHPAIPLQGFKTQEKRHVTTDNENDNLLESCGERGREGEVRRKEYLGLQTERGFLPITNVTWTLQK